MTPAGHQFAPFRLDAANQCLWRGTEQVSLSPKAFAVLLYLADRPGRLVTKQELLDAVWADIHVTEGVLKRAVLEIRKVLGDPIEEPRYIQTMHRRGYRFLAGSSGEPAAAVEETPARAGIVGRAHEFQQLDSWFERAMGSSRQMVFISGEAGLGKTTLVETWMQKAGQGGVAAARGRCLQQFGSGEPYLPVFEALDQLSRTLGRRLVEHLRSRAPTWLMHMPALISVEDRIKLRDEVFGSTRERMLREITDALEAVSAETPLVLALEDLHWSDPSTIDLLSSIARRTSPARLMILGTYRPSDAGAPLLAAQNELALHRQCKLMPLQYLSEEETGEYVNTRFPGMDSPDLAPALHRRTNGNPLYVVCLVDELERAGEIDADVETVDDLVPETLQQMFERQLSQLTAAEQDMLAAASAAGEAFAVTSVAAVLGRDATEVESQCESLVRRHVILKRGEVVRYPDGSESAGYSFLHALCRDALYRTLPAGRQARLHGMLGRVEEQLYAADPKRVAAELAGRFEIEGDVPLAIRYLRMAAEGAAGRHSTREATEHLEHAMKLVDRLREDERTVCRMDILEQRAAIRLSVWDLANSIVDLRALAEHACLAGLPERQTRALIETVHATMILDYKQALMALADAEAAYATGPNDPVLAAVLAVHRAFCSTYLYGWTEERAALFQAALPALRPLTDVRQRVQIAWMEAAVLCLEGQYTAAAKRADEARPAARQAGLFFDYFALTMYANWAHFHRGDVGQALRLCKENIELARKNGSILPERWFSVRQCWARMEAFECETGRQLYEEYIAQPGYLAQRHNQPILLWLGMARMGSGDLEGAWEAFQRLHEIASDYGFPFQLWYPLMNARAECALARGEGGLSKALAQELVDFAGKHHDPTYQARGLRVLAEVAIETGDLEAASESVAQAAAMLERSEAWAVEWRVHATASRVFARMGQNGKAQQARERCLRAAAKVADSLAGEPELRESFLSRVNRDLSTPRTQSA